MCPLPELPSGGLNRIGYIHELSGNSMTTDFKLNILSIGSGNNLSLQV